MYGSNYYADPYYGQGYANPPGGTSHTQSLGGAFSTSGALVGRSVGRTITATYSTSGSLIRRISRALTASFISSGVLYRLVSLIPFTAQMVPSGSLTSQPGKSLAASFSASGQLTKRPARILTATFNGSGVLNKFLNRLLSGTFSDSGVLTSSHTGGHSQLLIATFSTAGNIINRAVGQSLGSIYVSTGNLNKSTTRKLPAASFISSGALAGSRGLYQSLSGTYKASGNLVRTAGKHLFATFQAVGLLVSSIKPGPIKPPTHWANADIKNDTTWTNTTKQDTPWQNADTKNDTPWKQIG